MSERKSAVAPLLVGLLLAVLLLQASYGVSYFWLGQIADEGMGRNARGEKVVVILRAFPYSWMAWLFKPAGWLEGKLTGREIVAEGRR